MVKIEKIAHLPGYSKKREKDQEYIFSYIPNIWIWFANNSFALGS